MKCNDMFDANMSLVGYVYKREFYTYEDHHDDLIQEGYLALWKACLNFDTSKGNQFSTYACSAIRNNMRTYVNRIIRKHESVISLNSVIADNGEGDVLHLIDTLSDTKDDSMRYIIQDCLHKVSSRDRSIVLSLMDGHTQDEAASICHVSQSTVSRCLNNFKKLILEENQQ